MSALFLFLLLFSNTDPSSSIQCGCICFGLLLDAFSEPLLAFISSLSFSFYSSFLLKVLRPTLNDHGRSKGWSLSLQRPPSLVCFCSQISFLNTLQSSLHTLISKFPIFFLFVRHIIYMWNCIVSVFNIYDMTCIILIWWPSWPPVMGIGEGIEPRCLVIDGVTLGRKGLNLMVRFISCEFYLFFYG